MSNICMLDSGGRRQTVPLARMQSLAGLREIMIADPRRSAECFAEMQRRNARVRYVGTMLRNKFNGESDAQSACQQPD